MIDLIPSHAPDVIAEMVEGEVLLYHPQQTKALYLNPTAGAIWGLCDGQRSVREIISIVEACYAEPGTTLANDVVTALAELQGSGVVVIA